MHHLNYKRWTSYPQSANVICTWTLWLNGCEANYWDPVIVVIIFGGVSFDTYKSVAASLMTPKLSPQKLCPFCRRILSFRTSIFKLSVSPSFYVLSPSTHKSVFHFDSFLACGVKACFCHALKGGKKGFSDSSLSDDGVMWKRVRKAIPNTSHYKKKSACICILSLETKAVWSIMTDISNFSKCLHFHTLALKGKYSKSHT